MREDELITLLGVCGEPIAAEPYGCNEASDRAAASDKRFFELHPDRDVRHRSPIFGEFGPFVDYAAIAFVRVDKVRDDTRLRSIILRPGRRP